MLVRYDVHGGGWAVADPETDDDFCSFTAQTFNLIVVSIDYRKTPSWKFPYAVSDVAAIADAVIQDESLNIDSTKVVMGGFSAGATLAFAACQVESLRGRIYSPVGSFPCLDLIESVEDKLKRRPKEAGTDILESSANFLDWAYVPYGVNRRDPLVSSRWAGREDLPQHVYLVGAEYDMLCYESNQLAESFGKSRLREDKYSSAIGGRRLEAGRYTMGMYEGQAPRLYTCCNVGAGGNR